ncbi:MAG: hypothetical protein AAF513_19735 [Pseudomonadota bacterium]
MRITLIIASAALLGCTAKSPEAGSQWRSFYPVDLPYGVEGTRIVRDQEGWRAQTPDTTKPSPCDLKTHMLVMWQGPASSGCNAPRSGISHVLARGDHLEVGVYSELAGGTCQAYFEPQAAACVATSTLPVQFVAAPIPTVQTLKALYEPFWSPHTQRGYDSPP